MKKMQELVMAEFFKWRAQGEELKEELQKPNQVNPSWSITGIRNKQHMMRNSHCFDPGILKDSFILWVVESICWD